MTRNTLRRYVPVGGHDHLLAGKPVKYRTQGTWFVWYVKVRIGSRLPYVICGERIGSKTEDYVFYVRCPRWVGSGSNSA
jgi:hypothetical protein